jgi:hypothetical protein
VENERNFSIKSMISPPILVDSRKTARKGEHESVK